MKKHYTGYDTETVRQMVEEATAQDATTQTVWDLCRPGAPLEKAQIRPGFFSHVKTVKVIRLLLTRRLAAQLGRTSPRLDHGLETRCNTCHGVAAVWDRRWLCENGHGGNTNE